MTGIRLSQRGFIGRRGEFNYTAIQSCVDVILHRMASGQALLALAMPGV
ncbi:MAG: hypothetical protein WBX11_09875 [Thiobacillaceae bacterium]|jgi:hypothetical protein